MAAVSAGAVFIVEWNDTLTSTGWSSQGVDEEVLSDKLVSWLLKQGIRSMIAHPERNKDILRSIDKLLPFVRMGCLLQITAGAVAGSFGEPARARAADLLARGWVTVLASDAHNMEARPPELEPGRAAAAKIVGEEESWNLVRHRPAEIVE